MSSIDVIGKEKGITVPAYIRVAICPVGNINASTFRKYAAMIQKCEEVDLKQITRYAEEKKKSPFTFMDWNRNRMKFHFVDTSSISPQFTEVQQYRKVHSVSFVVLVVSTYVI
jgi:ABC-type arginine transport system permease subunit